mgnify:CR=1 FL=1
MPDATALNPELRIEPASEADRALLFAPFKAALHDYVDWAWGWDEDKERLHFFERLPLNGLFKLLHRGQCVGGFCIEKTPGQSRHLRTLFIQPESQGLGIGTAVLKHLIQGAQRQHLSLTLHVIQINPAKRLYERLGFRTVREEEKTFFMRLDSR